MIEFCYYGNFLLICYITLYGQSHRLFYTVYVCSTGIMGIAIIIFKLQAQFNSTDHLTATYMHIFPMISVWAIRWRDKIYSVDTWSAYFSFFEFNESEINTDFYFNQIFPMLCWLAWGIFYLLLNSTVLSKYCKSTQYESGIKDFLVTGKSLRFFLGDVAKNTLLKYIFIHLLCFISPMPIAWLSYKYFWFNTVYILLIILYLAINSARNNIRHLEKKSPQKTKKIKDDESDCNVFK